MATLKPYTATVSRGSRIVGTITVQAPSPTHAIRDLKLQYCPCLLQEIDFSGNKHTIDCLHEGTTHDTPDLLPAVIEEAKVIAQLQREAERRPMRLAEQRAYALLCEDYPLD
jgi:hypothetical protein